LTLATGDPVDLFEPAAGTLMLGESHGAIAFAGA